MLLFRRRSKETKAVVGGGQTAGDYPTVEILKDCPKSAQFLAISQECNTALDSLAVA
jgi:hypothetical protein